MWQRTKGGLQPTARKELRPSDQPPEDTESYPQLHERAWKQILSQLSLEMRAILANNLTATL